MFRSHRLLILGDVISKSMEETTHPMFTISCGNASGSLGVNEKKLWETWGKTDGK